MRILLLQGPMSPFFARVAHELERAGAEVYKINFNAGDSITYARDRSIAYRGLPESWSAFLETFLKHHAINAVLAYGDCRYYHRIAKYVSKKLGIKIYFFEEGYLRPHWITFEEGGVNAHSSLFTTKLPLHSQTSVPMEKPIPIPGHFSRRIFYSTLYYAAAYLGRARYPYYRHHRSLSPWREAFAWLRSGVRKWLYTWSDRKKWQNLESHFPDSFYLVPLQVREDSQVLFHSDFDSIESFISKSIRSFAHFAPKNVALVIKHHPMDRGHSHYKQHIAIQARHYGVSDRVFYVHDINNVPLLRQCLGVVTINSTMGLSALIHGKKVITLGRAIYNKPGICFQGTIDQFWQARFHPNGPLLKSLIDVIHAKTQLNGSFFWSIGSPLLPERFYRDLRLESASSQKGSFSN